MTTLCSSRTVHTAHVQQLNCCVKKRQTLLCPTCGLRTAQISILWITRSGLSCNVESTRDIASVDELKRRLIDVSCGLEKSIFERLLTSGEEDFERMSALKEDTLSTAYTLTMLILSISVTFNVTCLTVAYLIMKSCQQRCPIHSCSFYNSERLIKVGHNFPKLC